MVAQGNESIIQPAQDREILLTGEDLTIDQVVAVARQYSKVSLSDEARSRVRAARDVVDSVTDDQLVYGLNTELGPFAHQLVPADRLADYQISTIVGHAVAYGPQFETSAVRAMMLTRANGMAKAGVGVRAEIIDALIELLNKEVHPIVRSGGSIGQADLAEMSQIGLVLVGLGEAEYKGQVMPGDSALAAAGISPMVLQVKEALGLISANGVTLGYGSIVIADALQTLDVFNLSAALSLEAFGANLSIIHPAAARLKPHPGHVRTSKHLRRLLQGSYLWNKGAARKLQDSLSFRCIPQIHGSLDEACDHLRQSMEIELNSGGENPIVSIEDGTIVSVGNFDVTNIAVAFDNLRVALIHVIRLANERLHKHLWSEFSALPTGLAKPENPLTRLLPLARTCSSFTAEAQSLAHPISLSYTSQLGEGVEDHGSMAPLAVKATARLVYLAQRVAALELMISASAIDMRGNPSLGIGTEIAYEIVHAHPSLDANVWKTELERVVEAVSDGKLLYWANEAVTNAAKNLESQEGKVTQAGTKKGEQS
jgi:histidine ammonia-lyase